MVSGSNQRRWGPLLEVERSSRNSAGSKSTRVTIGAWAGIIIVTLLLLLAGDTGKGLEIMRGLLHLPW
jgi:hypothetical protein